MTKVCQICDDSLHENQSEIDEELCIACGEWVDSHLGPEDMMDTMMGLDRDASMNLYDGGFVNRQELADFLINRAALIRANTYNPPDWRGR